jgi:hypothetical protein
MVCLSVHFNSVYPELWDSSWSLRCRVWGSVWAYQCLPLPIHVLITQMLGSQVTVCLAPLHRLKGIRIDLPVQASQHRWRTDPTASQPPRCLSCPAIRFCHPPMISVAAEKTEHEPSASSKL